MGISVPLIKQTLLCCLAIVFLPASGSSGSAAPQVVTEAMGFLRGKSQAPRWAPLSLLPIRSVTDVPKVKYYVANVDYSENAYNVSLYMCNHRSPVGQVDLGCESVSVGMFGSFGVTLYSSSLAAKSALAHYIYDDCYDLKRGYAPSQVYIGSGVSGELWNDHKGGPILRWRRNGWRFAACSTGDPTGSDSVAEAKSLMMLVERYPLPALSGYMVASRGADNQNTRAAWLDDRAIVKTWALVPSWGVPLASAMSKWR